MTENIKRSGRKPRDSDDRSSGVLMHSQVTLTAYIPTSAVGAVIGRKGSTIGQIQKHVQSTGNGSIRLSIVSQEEPQDSVPYTYSGLDYSSPHWTPVVIRGSPGGVLAGTEMLQKIVGGELDEVVLDLPISRTKHALIIGKRGAIIANLSADTQVRIMVPPRALRHDVVQLEGDLENVKECLERIMALLADKKGGKGPPRATDKSSSSKTATTSEDQPESAPSDAVAGQKVGIVKVLYFPSQTKMRNIGRKTDTVIKKKKEGDEWQLVVTGPEVQDAVAILEKWHTDRVNAANAKGESPSSPSRPNPGRGGKGGRGSGRKGKKGPPKEKAPPAATESTST
jgi:hypothetical protein